MGSITILGEGLGRVGEEQAKRKLPIPARQEERAFPADGRRRNTSLSDAWPKTYGSSALTQVLRILHRARVLDLKSTKAGSEAGPRV